MKLCQLATRPSDVLRGHPLGDSLAAAAWSVSVVNTDVERDHASDRHYAVAKRGPALALGTLCTTAAVQALCSEHKARGGDIPTGLTSQKVQASGVPTQANPRRKRKAPSTPRLVGNAFMFYSILK